MSTVWIVDDDQSIRWVLEKALERAHIPSRSFASADAALKALESEEPAVMVTDVRMPGRDGISLLEDIRGRGAAFPVIVMTAYTDLQSTVSAFQKGAFEYLAKPFDVNEAVTLIRRGIHANTVHQAEATQTVSPAQEPPAVLHSASPAMQEIFRAIGRLAGSSATVLITGESGTGKELIARALHTHSNRAEGPFIALNAAAIPRDLLEAELFGHERGAFTGANQLRRGRFEEADGGTLFLDEIGDMPLELQTRLLRVLAEGTFYRVGGSRPVSVQVRIVAATHQPLEERVQQGRFREDLFHRLNVIRLRLPPLRERKADIPELVRLFLQQSAHHLGTTPRVLTPAAMQVLTQFDYPGNVRQLENFCHWMTVMSSGQLIDEADLPPELRSTIDARNEPHPLPARDVTERTDSAAPVKPTEGAGDSWTAQLQQEVMRRLGQNQPAIMSSLLREFEAVLIRSALSHSRQRRAEAAQRLGIGRNTLTRKCQELGIADGD